MLPIDADPILFEAQQLTTQARRVREALRSHPNPELQQEFRELQNRREELWSDPAHRETLNQALTERAGVLRVVAQARREADENAGRIAAADSIVARAIADRRSLTSGETKKIQQLRSSGSDHSAWKAEITSARIRDGVLTALGSVRLRDASAQLRSGLLMTEQMSNIIAEAVPALLRGEPLLLVGETGGAKTALAEHMCRRVVEDPSAEPELISGYGDITSAQLIGSHELRAEGGATVSVFVPGPLLRAMAEGRPVILDEVNAMPPEFLKRLNRILQLRPGDTLNVQEDAGRPVLIARGFAILATANEQTPHRYRGLDRLSAELVNRFGANSYRVHYPDTGRDYTEFPVENALLAAAAIVDRRGELPPGITVSELQRVSRAAFISQQVFAGAHGEGFDSFVSTEREIDGRPGLEESVLAPRTLVAILQKVAGSAGTVSLERALTRFVEGVMHREDRRVLALILEGQGFRLH
ncbi:AAA family ATPase [Leucobacter viscericola]|uniref:AAA family ATPase n=1 Tax=Leucobacter viscericola TaxID=2714935 RepID=A0A6G7XBX7_9MICO|nr:AAA family ATPase [Leucobacter viscericola]QIK62063.1 AAA family ATPase [Leucobacter viscericola]